jgi:putative MATE family efflux protein
MKIPTNNISILKKIITLALPIMLQAFLVNGVSFVDTLMIGQLGADSIAAIGVAAQLFFIITMLLNGIAAGAGIFISQYWGAKNNKGIQRVLGISISFTILCTGIIAIYTTIFPQTIMKLFTHETAIIEGGNTYLRFVGFSYVLTGISFMYGVGLRSTNDTKTPLRISLISLSVDVVGNYLLIFGIGIFPELGIAGGAISTSLSRLVELCLFIIVTNKRKDCPIRFSLKNSLKFDKRFSKKFFKTTTPVIINDIFWGLGFVCYRIAYAKIGTEALAAVQIIATIENLFLILIQGYAGAVAIIIGQLIGANKEHEVQIYSSISLRFSIFTGVLVGLLIVLISPIFVSLFNIDETVYQLSIKSLIMIAFQLPLVSFNIAAIVGLLRAGGDTKYTMYLELTTIWIVGVPLAFIGVLFWHLSLPQAYLLVGIEELLKTILAMQRIKSGKYIHNLIRK